MATNPNNMDSCTQDWRQSCAAFLAAMRREHPNHETPPDENGHYADDDLHSTIARGPTRRDVMCSAVAISGAAAVSMVPTPTFAEPNQDPEMWSLWREWKAALQTAKDCSDALGRALDAAEQEYLPAPCIAHSTVPYGDGGLYRSEIEQIAKEMKGTTTAEFEAEKNAAHERHGTGEAEEAWDRALDHIRNVEERIYEATAQSLLGVAIKLRVWRRGQDDVSGEPDFNGHFIALIFSAYNDASRMLGGILDDVPAEDI